MVKKLLAALVILSAFFVFSQSAFAYEKNINCGGSSYTAANGDIYIADQQYTPDNMAGYIDGSTGQTTSSISGTPDPTIYKTERRGVSEYKFDLPSGFYNVTLKFAETYFTSAGQRVFSVWLEGKKLITDLDIYSRAGAYAALDYTFTVEVKDGQLNIQAKATKDFPKFCAISVKSLVTPQPQELSLKGFNLTLDSTWNIAVNFSDRDDYFAAQELQNYIYAKYSLNIPLANTPNISGTKYIVLANPTQDSSIQTLLTQRNLYPEASLNEEGYLLESYPDNMIIISSNTPKGIFYGTQSLKQLISSSNNITTAKAVKIKDHPDNKMRGMHIMGFPADIKAKLDNMASLKMNMVIFDEALYFDLDDPSLGPGYRSTCQEIFNYARQRHFEVIPEISALWYIFQKKDPHCAEGLYVQDEQFKFANNVAAPIKPVNLTIENPSFETDANGDNIPDGWTFTSWSGGDSWTRDSTTAHTGIYSLRLNVPASNNIRSSELILNEYMEAAPNATYTLTFWAKAQKTGANFTPIIQLNECDINGDIVAYHTYTIKSTDWQKGELSIFTYRSSAPKLQILAVVDTGFGGGTVWIDDIEVKRMNGALVNVIRTDSSNIVITDLTKTKTYVESIDYNVVNGEMKAPFDASHTPSRIERIANGSIASNETVLVSYDFVVPIVGTLGVANYVCLSEPRTDSIFFATLRNIIQYFNPNYISVPRSEMMGINRDSRCQKKNVSNAQLLAGDINKLNDYIHSINPNIRMMTWDDMLNLWHNGGDENYQVQYGGPIGNTSDAADLISKDVIPLIWWYSSSDYVAMKNSPAYFKSKGFDYLVSPWYDETNIRLWADILRERKDGFGVLDTAWFEAPQAISWLGLTPSADYSWCYKGIPYAVSSSNESYDTQAANAIDGNSSTRWSSQFSDPQWIYIDFTTKKTFDSVKLRWETAYAKQYQIQTSDDAVNWTTIYTETNSNGGIDIINLPQQYTARYVRMYGTQRATQWGYSLYEFEAGSFSPKAFWPMDENTGYTIYDKTPYNNTGSIYGATWTQGISNSSLKFDGVDDYVDVADSPTLHITDNLTVSAWVYIDSWAGSDSYARIVSKFTGGSSASGYILCRETTTSKLLFLLPTNQGTMMQWTPVLEEKKWYHIAGVFDGTSIKLYINGAKVSESTFSRRQLLTNNLKLYIGGEGSSYNLKGSTDEVRIYSYALTQEEIKEEYNRCAIVAYASSQENSTLSPDKAIDNNLSTRWSSVFSDPQWIYIDFKAPRTFSKVTLNWETAYGKSYKIQVSNDAVTWTDIYSTTTGDGATDIINISPQTARYVRMYGTQRATQWGYSLWEFKVE